MVDLTPRQRTLLEHVFAGKSNKQIAELCGGVSPLTVKNHLLHIYSKLGVHSGAHSRIDAIRVALARGILKPPAPVRPEPLPPPPPVTDWLKAGNLSLSPSMRYAAVDGRRLELRPPVLLLLAALIARPGLVYSRQKLLDYVVGEWRCIEERAIDVYVSELRKALSAAGATCSIRTVREHGYGLEAG